jgi:hypothetical protein
MRFSSAFQLQLEIFCINVLKREHDSAGETKENMILRERLTIFLKQSMPLSLCKRPCSAIYYKSPRTKTMHASWQYKLLIAPVCSQHIHQWKGQNSSLLFTSSHMWKQIPDSSMQGGWRAMRMEASLKMSYHSFNRRRNCRILDTWS